MASELYLLFEQTCIVTISNLILLQLHDISLFHFL